MSDNTTKPTETKPKDGRILFQKWHDITPFCANDSLRFQLKGVHVNIEKGRLEATDGKRLALVPLQHGLNASDFPATPGQPITDAKDCILPTKQFSTMLKKIPKKGKHSLPILQTALFGQSPTGPVAVTTDLDLTDTTAFRPIEAQFPNVETVIPTERPTLTIAFNPQYLADICQYAAKFCQSKNQTIKLEFWDESKPMRASCFVADNTKATFILMPCRLT